MPNSNNGNNPIVYAWHHADHTISGLLSGDRECFWHRYTVPLMLHRINIPWPFQGLRSVSTPSKLKDWSLLSSAVKNVLICKLVRPNSHWPNTGEPTPQDGIQLSRDTPLKTAMFVLRPEERGVERAIFVKLETPSPNKGGGVRHQLPACYNAVLGTLPESCRIVRTQQHMMTGTVHTSLIMQMITNDQ